MTHVRERTLQEEVERLRNRLHTLQTSHFLVPHTWATEMAISLMRVRPVTAPPFQFGVAVREVVEELLRERERSRVLEEKLTASRSEAARMRLRLRTRVADRISPVCDGGTTTWQCECCGMTAESLSDIRHVDGTAIGTRPCGVLLDLVALGVES